MLYGLLISAIVLILTSAAFWAVVLGARSWKQRWLRRSIAEENASAREYAREAGGYLYDLLEARTRLAEQQLILRGQTREAEILRLEARVEALTAALREIADYDDGVEAEDCPNLRGFARAALATSEQARTEEGA